MGVLGLNKNKEVPLELPDLISDEIEKEALGEIVESVKESAQITDTNKEPANNFNVINKSIEDYKAGNQEAHIISKEIVKDAVGNSTPILTEKKINLDSDKHPGPLTNSNNNIEKSFFRDLQENLEKEILDVESLEKWYELEFSSRDMLGDMRTYWKKQKNPSIINALGKNFQIKISEKIQDLQSLEKSWQNTYFELIEKEEEIKDMEKELKKMLNEFLRICKHKKKSLSNNEKEEEK